MPDDPIEHEEFEVLLSFTTWLLRSAPGTWLTAPVTIKSRMQEPSSPLERRLDQPVLEPQIRWSISRACRPSKMTL
jgi:hypothetical protein